MLKCRLSYKRVIEVRGSYYERVIPFIVNPNGGLKFDIERHSFIRSPLNSVCCPQIVVSGEAVHENLQGLYTRAENKLNGRSK